MASRDGPRMWLVMMKIGCGCRDGPWMRLGVGWTSDVAGRDGLRMWLVGWKLDVAGRDGHWMWLVGMEIGCGW